MTEPDYVAVNREGWTRANAEYTDARAREAWAQEEITWGKWSLPESEIQGLPDVTGVDVTPAQLATARQCQQELGIEFPLVEASAEDVPLPDASFDLALSEYGASIWCEPERWVAEAARLLRPGGDLVFLVNSTLAILCSPDEGKVAEQLQRPQFGMHRFVWPPDEEINFYIPHGEWIRVLTQRGFEVVALHELQAPAEAMDHPRYDFVSAEWARKWPSEDIWRARKRA